MTTFKTNVTTPEAIAENFGEPAAIGFGGTCTCCEQRSDRCTCEGEPYYAMHALHRRIAQARGDFERAVLAQLDAGIPHRQIAWQAGLTVGSIQAVERKHR